jgi:hypothetical protein
MREQAVRHAAGTRRSLSDFPLTTFSGFGRPPARPVLDIRLHSPTNTLYASTFGPEHLKISLDG